MGNQTKTPPPWGRRPKNAPACPEFEPFLAQHQILSVNAGVHVVVWEAVALTLAEKAGITTAKWRLETIIDKPVLILRRFDRQSGKRVPFLSAMNMLGAKDNDPHSYLE